MSAAKAADAPIAAARPREARAPARRISFEHEGYIADPLLFGRACYRAGRWDDALAALATCGDVPTARYWSSRCLERLGRRDEAIASYRALIAASPDALEARIARDAIAFLEWQSLVPVPAPSPSAGAAAQK
jgi:hypothetical protein